MPLWAAHPPPFLHPSCGKGFPLHRTLVGLCSLCSSLLPLSAPHRGGPHLQSPEPLGQGPEGEEIPPELPFLPRSCLWTASRAWSPVAQPPQRPRAQHLGVAAPPAHPTWVRKAEWPVGAPQVWRPRSLSATRFTTRCPPVGVRAEELRHSRRDRRRTSSLQAPPRGPAGSSLRGTRQMDEKKVKGVPGTPHCPPLLWRR